MHSLQNFLSLNKFLLTSSLRTLRSHSRSEARIASLDRSPTRVIPLQNRASTLWKMEKVSSAFLQSVRFTLPWSPKRSAFLGRGWRPRHPPRPRSDSSYFLMCHGLILHQTHFLLEMLLFLWERMVAVSSPPRTYVTPVVHNILKNDLKIQTNEVKRERGGRIFLGWQEQIIVVPSNFELLLSLPNSWPGW